LIIRTTKRLQLGEHLVTFDADFRKLLRRTQLTVLVPD